MIMDLFYGCLFGFTLQVGLGPVNIATWLYGITHGWKKSLKVSVGVALADYVYIIIAFLLKTSLSENVMFYLSLISGVFLLYLGHKSYFSKNKTSKSDELFKNNLIFSGFILNILNPKAIIMWLSLLTLLNKDFVFISGIPFSTIIWLGLMPLIFHLIKIDKYLLIISKYGNKIIGCVFVFYGILLFIFLI